MIDFDFSNVFRSGVVSRADFESQEGKLDSFLKQIDARNQGFYRVIDDEEMVTDIEAFSKSVKGKYDDIVVCGIGGSALGTITLRDAFANFFEKSKVGLHVLENIDPVFLSEALEALNLKRTLFLVISKSGGTPETLAQYFFFRQHLDKAGLVAKDHLVFITGEKGLLREVADQDGIPTFSVPEDVGGRFSVLTPVGLLPAALVGLDIRALLQGARSMRDAFLSVDFEENKPFQLAVLQWLCSEKGYSNNVLMPYVMKLRTFAGWFAQLLAESTGKFNSKGKSVGLTPIASLGVTDQHSQLQLFAEGPKDKLVLFLQVEKFSYDMEIPVLVESDKTRFLKGVSFQNLLHAENKATAESLTEGGRPNLMISLDTLSLENMGGLFLLFEGATAFLGEFLDINTFDQPGVERSKVLTRESLSECRL